MKFGNRYSKNEVRVIIIQYRIHGKGRNLFLLGNQLVFNQRIESLEEIFPICIETILVLYFKPIKKGLLKIRKKISNIFKIETKVRY